MQQNFLTLVPGLRMFPSGKTRFNILNLPETVQPDSITCTEKSSLSRRQSYVCCSHLRKRRTFEDTNSTSSRQANYVLDRSGKENVKICAKSKVSNPHHRLP